MRLRKRQQGKKEQALDAVASIAQSWSKWHLTKSAGKGVAKGAQKASKLPDAVKQTKVPVKIIGGLVVVGGAGALIAKKLKGGDPEPIYTPPAPMEPVAAPPVLPVELIAPTADVVAPAPAAEPELAAATALAADPVPALEPDVIVVVSEVDPAESEFAAQPVVELAVEPGPVVEPELVVDPDPFMDPLPLTEPEPLGEPQPFLEPEPLVEPQPLVEPELLVEPEPLVEPMPGALPADGEPYKPEAGPLPADIPVLAPEPDSDPDGEASTPRD